MTAQVVEVALWSVRSEVAAPVPKYMTAGASGCDLEAAIEAPLVLAVLGRTVVPTGIGIALPAGYEGQIRPRSGRARRDGLGVLNAPGTIDSDYRGEIGVLLVNLGSEPLTIAPRERIAQLVIAPVVQARFRVVPGPPEEDGNRRGDGGFGHTGTGSFSPESTTAGTGVGPEARVAGPAHGT